MPLSPRFVPGSRVGLMVIGIGGPALYGTDAPTPEPSVVDPTGAVDAAGSELADLALRWADGHVDLAVVNDDLASDAGLQTAVFLSLFTDRRAADDDALPEDNDDRRGWWADEFAAVEGDLFGSRLWLLDRSARRSDVVLRVNEFVREALAWMVEDKVVEKIDVEAETAADGPLLFAVKLMRPNGDQASFRFAHTWEAEATR